jgi:site-specific recombinase XerD
MAGNTIVRLEQGIDEYLKTIKDEARRFRSMHYLIDFVAFVKRGEIPWDDIFTMETLKGFQRWSILTKTSATIRGLSSYLFTKNRIQQPFQASSQIELPPIYEQYLDWYKKSQQALQAHVAQTRRVLCTFHRYLEKSKIELGSLRIEHVDTFLAGFHARFSPGTCRVYRSPLKAFLSYLYHERGIIRRDLASLLVGKRIYTQAKPPKFLRPHEVRTLFASLKLSSPWDIRNSAIVHLAYTLGLRPKEISQISLDDISLTKAELTLRDRKNQNPMTLPLPEATIKAVAAYLIGVRAKSEHRTLFLSLPRPYRPMSPGAVVSCIWMCMREAGLPGSAYWLRHTYAQNLLEAGASIFEIMQMLGHDNMQSTQGYLHVHTKLMREVLFDETL